MVLASGNRLGPYEILDAIGAGGMGQVYRAKDAKLGRDVAVKVLPEEFARDQERLDRFEREAKLLASLNHPAIATLYGFEDGFLVMELVEGETLAERIARGPLPLEEAIPLFVQMAEGLEAAHDKSIVHRDLKPANVKITPEGKIKILDFGLAKAFAPKQDVSAETSQSPTLTKGTALGVIMGTASYMSPEQARGKDVDKRTDIWAFGCCCYEALSGKKAFRGETVTDVLAAVVKTDPDWSGLPKTTPQWTRRLIERCLNKDPRYRLHDIADARIELDELRHEREGPSHTTEDTAPRSRTLAWMGALLATAVLTAFVVRLFPSGSIETEPDIRLRQITGRPDNDTLHSAALSPNGESLAFATETGLFLYLVATGEEQQVPLPEGLQIHEVDWLGGGSTLLLSAASAGDIGLYKTSIFGGTPSKLSDDAWRAAVSPDGARIAYLQSQPSQVLRIMDADGGNARTLAELEGDDSFWEIAWSPDARWLLVGRWGGAISPYDTVLEAIDVDTGEIRQLMSDPRFFQNWRGFLPFAWAPDGRLVFARREPPPNELSSNLWQVDIDLEAASLRGDPVRLTRLNGFNLKDLSVTTDGRSVSFLLERNQNDVLVADLAPDGTIREPRPVTTDERADYALGWSPDGETIFFESFRTGASSLFRLDAEVQGRPQFVAGKGEGTHFFEVNPDGRSVTYWAGSELKRVPAGGGPVETVLTAGEWPGHSCTSGGETCLVGERAPHPRRGSQPLELTTALRTFCAIDTQERGRIEIESLGGDLLSASSAIAVLVTLHPIQGGLDALQVRGSAAVRFDRHRLRLEGIHPGETSDTGLIELHRAGGGLAGVSNLEQLFAERDESGSELLESLVMHRHGASTDALGALVLVHGRVRSRQELP